MKVHVWSAFTKKGKGGNLAGVVLLDQEADDATLQKIAKDAGYSETAFIRLHSQQEHIRFFTPQKEVNICGHATIASYAFLFAHNYKGAGHYTMLCKAGLQSISIADDGRVSMSQNLPEYGPVIPSKEVSAALNIDQRQLHPTLPIQIASTGLHKIFVPLRSLKALQSITPNHKRIIDVSTQYGAIGMYCYTLESLYGSTAHCRNFAPVVGIFEDSATGTSAAALSTLLFSFGILSSNNPLSLVYEQGYQINSPSELHVSLRHNHNEIQEVRVAGYACPHKKNA